ncbi:MAG: phenylalanine--tRNA ligase beta subunit-related protein [Candidatus Pacebacteria bacterium]|nr:phenylalanine--tRNA ligase beta subunit-related protein [Candidatus Paceibacterota bacterium]
MLISYNWLKKYFDKELPNPKDLAVLLNSHSFEVEGVEEKSNDTIFDIDVLPNRAHDCLCHRGMAKEVSVITGLKMNDIQHTDLEIEPLNDFKVMIEDEKKCRRYVAVVMEGVKVGPSPDWLKQNLESLGQKSINNIVDATNYVMFNIGQPLHAFDKDKLDGNEINIRNAKDDERIVTLDNKEIVFTPENLVIADSKDPLAIAGVKGGKKAEVDQNTVNLVLESANFAPITVRKTARGFSILTDSSKRFENEISPELAGVAMRELVELITEIAGGKAKGKVDVYPRKPNAYKVGFTTADANKILGLNLSDKDVEEILNKFRFDFIQAKPLEKVLELANGLIGKPYKLGASVVYDAPHSFDCSSFTAYLFAQAGVAIPRMAVDQFVFGKEISESDLQAGDLVFSNTGEGKIYFESVEFLSGTKVEKGVDHVGLYLGNGDVVHASRYNSDGVEMGKISDFKQFKNTVGYRRMIESEEKRYVVTIPYQRMDLRIKQDLIEEIGRIYGLENIKTLPLEKIREPKVHKGFYYTNKVKQILIDLGFEEIYNYTFTSEGNVKIEKPLASDKAYLRTNLFDGMKEKLELNLKNAPLLGLDEIKIFEFGKVFPSTEEEKGMLCFGVAGKNKKSVFASVSEAIQKINIDLGIDLKIKENENIVEIDFDTLIEKLPQPESYEDVLKNPNSVESKYKHISPFPFMLRDIAVWVPNTETQESVAGLIKENGGDLLVKTRLFDTYKPEGKDKTSYAFSLVFQSNEKTLTDDEINKIMEKISSEMAKKGWEVR